MHLNRMIKKYDLDMIYISGPGHGGEAMIANNYLEGVYTKFYKDITMDEAGMKKLFKQFSFPGGYHLMLLQKHRVQFMKVEN